MKQKKKTLRSYRRSGKTRRVSRIPPPRAKIRKETGSITVRLSEQQQTQLERTKKLYAWHFKKEEATTTEVIHSALEMLLDELIKRGLQAEKEGQQVPGLHVQEDNFDP